MLQLILDVRQLGVILIITPSLCPLQGKVCGHKLRFRMFSNSESDLRGGPPRHKKSVDDHNPHSRSWQTYQRKSHIHAKRGRLLTYPELIYKTAKF